MDEAAAAVTELREVFYDLTRSALETEKGDDPPYETLREAVSVALAMLEENRQAAAEQVLHKATRRHPAPDTEEGT